MTWSRQLRMPAWPQKDLPPQSASIRATAKPVVRGVILAYQDFTPTAARNRTAHIPGVAPDDLGVMAAESAAGIGVVVVIAGFGSPESHGDTRRGGSAGDFEQVLPVAQVRAGLRGGSPPGGRAVLEFRISIRSYLHCTAPHCTDFLVYFVARQRGSRKKLSYSDPPQSLRYLFQRHFARCDPEPVHST